MFVKYAISCTMYHLLYVTGVYLEMDFDNPAFHITTVMHPHTYLNKIVFGSKQGKLQLWNLKQDKMLYLFDGWNSPVTCIEQVLQFHLIASLLEGSFFQLFYKITLSNYINSEGFLSKFISKYKLVVNGLNVDFICSITLHYYNSNQFS